MLHDHQAASSTGGVGHAPARVGRCNRPDDYDALEDMALQYEGRPGLCTAQVLGLVLRTVHRVRHRETGARLSARAAQLLAILVDHVWATRGQQRNRWEDGDLVIRPGNARLAMILDVDERIVRRALAELEDHWWLIRRYTHLNHRGGDAGGIDLRPLAARLDELLMVQQAGADALVARYEAMTSEHDDRIHVMDSETGEMCSDRIMESRGEDRTIRRKYKVKNPQASPVQKGASQVSEGVSPEGGHMPATPDAELAFLMRQSPTVNAYLPPDVAGSASPEQIVRAVLAILSTEFKLSASAWSFALRQYGWAALAAVVCAADKGLDARGKPIVDRTRYLAGMLKRSNLHATVVHSLRHLLSRPESGRG